MIIIIIITIIVTTATALVRGTVRLYHRASVQRPALADVPHTGVSAVDRLLDTSHIYIHGGALGVGMLVRGAVTSDEAEAR